MSQKCFIVDCFTTEKFRGNPAAVCLFEKRPADDVCLKIAAEFNLPVTAFVAPAEDGKHSIRWFTTTQELELCGHGTVAATHVLYNHTGYDKPEVHYKTTSVGSFSVRCAGPCEYELNFPLYKLNSLKVDGIPNTLKEHFDEIEAPEYFSDILKAFKIEDMVEGAVYAPQGKGCAIVLDSSTTRHELESLKSCSAELLRLHPGGELIQHICLTLMPKDPVLQGFLDDNGRPYDYASRMFGPWIGVDEDPATGSSHCMLAQLWSKIRSGVDLYACQSFPTRGGYFTLKPKGNRVGIVGAAVTLVEGVAHF
ncbi:hypothetical protein L596_005265 [Steinernema carpocapsae]|uniref:Phenazine biosynthesis-like domain-containing protein n=1 Tax=Steinernema carpocapsae TaxID=34508 RepID=A0A4U8UYE9_STECR|nr:hypothetical protein L596_005265 [Steinernema carpocapsae]